MGIAHGVKLMNLQVITADGIGAVDPLVEAIYYAVDNGADIINISMVGRGIVDEIRSAVYYAYQKGVVVVGAGGNDMEDLNIIPQFPICADAYDPFSAIIGVSAVGEDRRLASFSNIGASCIDITAPGVNIAGPIRGGLSNLEGKTYVRGWNGTSFATPFISAAAALIKSIQPSWGVDQIVRTIQSTVRHTPSEDEVAYREIYGKGLLQIGSAVESAAMGVMLGPRTFVEGDYDTLFTSPRRLIIASEGGVKYGDIVQGRKVEVGAPFLPGAYAIAGVRDAIGNPYIVTLQKKTETESVVIVRTWSGFERGRWSIEAGDHQLLGADMSDTPGTEIVVLNKKTGKITIFSLEGVREGEVRGMGGSLKRVATTESIPETGRDALIYADELAGSIVVSRLTGMASSSEKIFETTVHKSLGSITEFTRDTDGESVIAMGTSIGASPVVTLFDMDGVLIHSFRPYDLSFRGGVSVDTIVHGMKGSEHLVVVPERGVQPMRVFDWAGSRVLDRSIDTIVAPNRRVLSTVVPF